MSLTAVAVDRYRTVSAVTSAPYLARGRGGGGARAAATILAINTAAMAATLPYTLHMQVPGYIYTIYSINMIKYLYSTPPTPTRARRLSCAGRTGLDPADRWARALKPGQPGH